MKKVPLINHWQRFIPYDPWHVFQYSSSVRAAYIEHCFRKQMMLNEWMRVWCFESRKFAAGIPLLWEETPRFLCILSQARTTSIGQSSFFAELDGWLTCAKRQKTFKRSCARVLLQEKKSAVSYKVHKIPSEQGTSNWVDFPALSTNIWASIEGFFAQCLPTMF